MRGVQCGECAARFALCTKEAMLCSAVPCSAVWQSVLCAGAFVHEGGCAMRGRAARSVVTH